MGERRVTADGRILERLPDGTIIEVGRQDAPMAPEVISPAPPPAPPQAPGRTPSGAATEGLKPGFRWVDPSNPAAGQVPIEIVGGPAPSVRPEITSANYSDAVNGFTASLALGDIIKDLEAKFRAGPGSTQGASSVLDYLPTAANQQFDRAGQAARGTVASVLGFTGGQLNSAAEANLNLGPFIPSASDFDSTSADAIKRLKDLQKQGLQRSIAVLGGVIDASGNVIPVPANFEATPENVQKLLSGKAANREDNGPGNAMNMIRTNSGGGGSGGGAAPRADVGTQQFQTISNPAMARAHDELVQTLLAQGGGRLDPQAYASGRMVLARDFGVNLPNPNADMQGAMEWANSVNRYLDAGGRTIPTNLTMQQVMSARDTMANNLVNSPVGGFGIGAANGVSAGLTEALAPGLMAALRDAQSGATALGEVGGAVGATYGMGAAGRALAGRFAPQLLGGGNMAQLGRAIAPDVAYGALYGNNTEGDPLTGAALGAAGSLAGQGVARGLGAGIGGLQRTAAAQALRDRGVPISVARQLGMGRAEDIIQSLPLAGDASRARQADSFVGFNQAAFQEAGKPIGANIPPISGRDGLDALGQEVGNAYDAATRGVTVGIDPQFTTDFAALSRQIGGLPGDYQAAAQQVVQNRVAPAVAGGQMTGETYQQAIRGLRAARSNADNVGNTGFEQDYRDVLGNAEAMLTGAMGRGGGQQTIEGLARANEAYGNLKILEDAALNRAKVGTRTGEVNVFAPSQLLEAARRSETKFGNGAALRQLGEQGQEVLPSTVPNSGTADRTTALALLAGAGGVGGGLGLANDQSAQGAASGAGTGLGTLAATSAILGLLGTRGGQRALEQILISRPQVAQRVGQGVRRRGGLFGSAGTSLALQAY